MSFPGQCSGSGLFIEKESVLSQKVFTDSDLRDPRMAHIVERGSEAICTS